MTKNTKELFDEIEKDLFDKGLISEEKDKRDIVLTNGYCDWCDNQCKGYPYISWFENDHYSGWFSPQCRWLALQASECVDKDDS